MHVIIDHWEKKTIYGSWLIYLLNISPQFVFARVKDQKIPEKVLLNLSIQFDSVCLYYRKKKKSEIL